MLLFLTLLLLLFWRWRWRLMDIFFFNQSIGCRNTRSSCQKSSCTDMACHCNQGVTATCDLIRYACRQYCNCTSRRAVRIGCHSRTFGACLYRICLGFAGRCTDANCCSLRCTGRIVDCLRACLCRRSCCPCSAFLL